jgi:hypothetical protein
MTENEKKIILDKVVQYGIKMSQGKLIAAQRIYTDLNRTIKTDKEQFFKIMEA